MKHVKRMMMAVAVLIVVIVGMHMIDIPCGADPWPPCDLNPPSGSGGGGA